MILFAKGDKDWSGIPYKEQREIIQSFPEPQNDFERSYFQYKCQTYFISKRKRLVFDLFSFLALPFLVICLLIARFFSKKESKHRDAIASVAGCKSVVPDCLINEYDIDYDVWMNGFSLTVMDIAFLWNVVVKTPFAPYYVLKITLKTAAYSEMIHRYSPKAFIVNDEYSFTSSLMTYYSNLFGVEQIDVMHGEKLYYIGDGFFRYNRCYVWDEHYKDLFIKLRAEAKQFIVEQPKALKLNVNTISDSQNYSKYTYYLQIYSEGEIRSIIKSLKFVEKEGERVKFRPHPLFSDINLLRKYVKESDIEMPREVPLEQSLANTDVVIGYFSTVQYQAYLAGKEVVLDDVTFKDGYLKLKEHDYIMSNFSNVGLLSEKQAN